MDSALPEQPEDSPGPESTSGSSSLSWDAPPAIDGRKAALVETAFRGLSSLDSVESVESESGGDGDSEGGGPERSLSAEPEPEPGRRLRSVADRRAGLEAALLAGAERPPPAEFDDFTVHLYRKTADFADRRSRVAELVFGPVRPQSVCRGVARCSGV